MSSNVKNLFFDELYKDDSDTESDSCIGMNCLICHEKINTDSVVLKCGHKFHYDCIFNDAYNHKKRFQKMEIIKLHYNQIRCPYCRNVQHELLLPKDNKPDVYGVNCYVNVYSNYKFFQFHNWKKNYADFNVGWCTSGVPSSSKSLSTTPETVVKCKGKNVIYNPLTNELNCRDCCQRSINENILMQINNVFLIVNDMKENLKVYDKQEELLKKNKNKELEKIQQMEIMVSNFTAIQKSFECIIGKSNVTNNANLQTENKIISSNTTNIDIDDIKSELHTEGGCITKEHAYTTINRCVAVLTSGKNKNKQCGSKSKDGTFYCGRHMNIKTLLENKEKDSEEK
tara:strand:+ start:951 stop:1976 length:1026 start_codon:yes stop_codon:yes gene_type:complete